MTGWNNMIMTVKERIVFGHNFKLVKIFSLTFKSAKIFKNVWDFLEYFWCFKLQSKVKSKINLFNCVRNKLAFLKLVYNM